jgi:tetratricopeptide (TPR) repeat protein
MDIEKTGPGTASGAANAAAQAAELLTSGKVNDARAVLHSAMRQWPGSLELQLGLAEVAIKEGKAVEGRAILKALQEKFPNQWQPALAVASLHLRNKKREWARWALAQAVALGAPREAVLRLQVSLAHQEGNLQEFESSLKSVAQSDGADDRARMGLLNLLVSQGRPDEAVAFAEEALERDPTAESLYFFLLRIARHRWDAARIVEICERHERAFPANPIFVASQIRALVDLSRSGDAKVHALHHRLLWRSDRWLIAAVSRLSWSAGERPIVVAILAEIARSRPASAAMVSACLLGLLAVGADQQVREILDVTPSDRVENGDLLRALSASLPEIGNVPTFEGAATVVARPGSSKCLLVFSGAGDGIRIPRPLLHRLIALLDVHVIYFHDELRTSQFSDAGAGLADSVRVIRDMVESLGNPDVYAYGNSSGSFAAVRFGVELGAQGVVVSDVATGSTRGQESDDGQTVAASPTVPERDLGSILIAANPRPKILVYHRAGSRGQVRHLADIDGVQLRPIAESRGATMFRMIERGLLVPALREIMGIDHR